MPLCIHSPIRTEGLNTIQPRDLVLHSNTVIRPPVTINAIINSINPNKIIRSNNTIARQLILKTK